MKHAYFMSNQAEKGKSKQDINTYRNQFSILQLPLERGCLAVPSLFLHQFSVLKGHQSLEIE